MDDFQFDDEEDGLLPTNWEWGGRDATIFVIDVSDEMTRPFNLQENEEILETPLTRALRCIHATLCRRIIASDKDLSGILLYNTKETKNDRDCPYIYTLQDVELANAERILELESYLEDGGCDELIQDLGQTKDASLHHVLWVCRNMFNSSKNKLLTKNIIMFTHDDDPHSDDVEKKRQAFKGSKDVYEAGIQLEILPLSDTFDMKKFYKAFLTEGNEDETQQSLSVMSDPTFRFEELLDRVRRFEHKQRTTGKIPFTLAPGVEFGVKVFTSIRKATKPSGVKLHKAENELVRSNRRKCLESGEPLMPSELAKYQVYGVKKLKFSLNEIKQMSRVYKPGIEVLGFKPRSSLKPYHYIKPANFLFPDEESFKGSTKLFTCLLERCLARNMCPLARVQIRENASCAWAFLLPQKEQRDERNAQIQPSGFSVCYLPFADDFRNIEVEGRTRAQQNQVDAAAKFMKKLHFKYHPDSFENPDLQTHWRNVEALALNRTELEPVCDYTLPDNKKIEKKAHVMMEEFKALVVSSDYDPDQVIKKRPAGGSSSANKKAKLQSAHETPTVEDMAKLKKVDKLTVDVLKKWLQERGVKVASKKKADLVQNVYEELEVYSQI